MFGDFNGFVQKFFYFLFFAERTKIFGVVYLLILSAV